MSWDCAELLSAVATVVCTPPFTSFATWRCAYWLVYASAHRAGQARGSARCTKSPWVKTDPVTGADAPAVAFGAQYSDVVVESVTCSAHGDANGETNATYTVACVDPDTADWLLTDVP